MGELHHLGSVAVDREVREARNKARPRLAAWRRRIEAEIRDGWLANLEGRLAEALTNFPSANRGIAWPGQMRLAGTLGKSDRTVRRSLARLEARGFLMAKQQGWNRSCCYTFMMDGKPLIQSVLGLPTGEDARAKMSAYDRTKMSAWDRTKMSTYLLESESFEFESLERPRPRPSELPREKKRSADEHNTPIGSIIDHVVRKLGRGNDNLGWSIYRQLPHDVKADLRNREREGTLDDEVIETFLHRGSA
jgi:Helix-turn-helix domain